MPADLVRRIREIVGMPPHAPSVDLPRFVEQWGLRKLADGIIEGREQEFRRLAGGLS